MSGIYIPGMEMPKTCCGCKMMIYNPELVWDDNGRETVGAWVCLLTAELIDNTKREEHCPLIELSPHGRLIDADADPSEYVTVWDCDCSEFGKQTVMAVDDLNYLPTIIPADGGDDNG